MVGIAVAFAHIDLGWGIILRVAADEISVRTFYVVETLGDESGVQPGD